MSLTAEACPNLALFVDGSNIDNLSKTKEFMTSHV